MDEATKIYLDHVEGAAKTIDIIRDLLKGLSVAEIVKKYGVHRSRVYKIKTDFLSD
ncbi:helix-turn-helix domain containing protein [Shewanella olleyana]|uniref:helix-turn-helix domain-containing protein n=1 Tax=Shewanella olleyana TaxID=135626 RepID=UPI00200EF640|nr:helix-turn-helix domain-containing protein [Shewanella olleyana]MCL1067930.1 helix-turn-helix domain containing protein [Shewanella olleyana]